MIGTLYTYFEVALNLETGDIMRIGAMREGGEAFSVDEDLREYDQLVGAVIYVLGRRRARW